MKIVAIIPAHLASVRFPRKILCDIHGLPMIEHVRRRSLLSSEIDRVIVATCDKEIGDTVSKHGGEVIYTSNSHKNGTTRVAEAIEEIDCTHVLLLQGDEPLILPRHIDLFVKKIRKDTESVAWNATGDIESKEELDRKSFVKCFVNHDEQILFCFRRSPCYSSFKEQKKSVRKILGIIAYKKEYLLELVNLPDSIFESIEFIEQMRIIENNALFRSVKVTPALPSINEESELDIVLETLAIDTEQKQLLEKITKRS